MALAKNETETAEISKLLKVFEVIRKMIRAGYIYEKIYESENIRAAIYCAGKGKKDRKEVNRVLKNVDDCVEEIQHMLITQEYYPSPYKIKTIREGLKQKERIIHVPKFFPDQIIQWALILQIQPYLCKGMYPFTCGSIPGRGVEYGRKYLEKWIRSDRKHTKYCLKMDVHHFYPSIDHAALKSAFREKFKDQKLLRLVDLIIDSCAEGLPIGNITSQWFANFYLQRLDHKIKEEYRAPYYMRYMDDMVILGPNKKQLHKCLESISKVLAGIGLRMKNNWQIFKTDSRGIDFMGYRFFHYKTTLRRAIMLRISRKVKKTFKKNRWNSRNCAAIISYLGWISHSDSYRFFQKYIIPYVNIKKMKGVIRHENIKHSNAPVAF